MNTDNFPLESEIKDSSIAITWKVQDTELRANMLDNVITELRNYLQDSFAPFSVKSSCFHSSVAVSGVGTLTAR